SGSWDYRIVAPGYKYNLTDIAASIGIHQLARAEQLRRARQEIAEFYSNELRDLPEIELPPDDENRVHSWHLFPIRFRLNELTIDRAEFIEKLKIRGVGSSVHWRPLHLHPYYAQNVGWQDYHLPNATRLWSQIISLPIFPSMTQDEVDH